MERISDFEYNTDLFKDYDSSLNNMSFSEQINKEVNSNIGLIACSVAGSFFAFALLISIAILFSGCLGFVSLPAVGSSILYILLSLLVLLFIINKNIIDSSLSYCLLLLILGMFLFTLLGACGLAADEPSYLNVNIVDGNDTVTEKKVFIDRWHTQIQYIGNCGVTYKVNVKIPIEYEHYKNELHFVEVFTTRNNSGPISTSGNYEALKMKGSDSVFMYYELYIAIPCSFCVASNLSGLISVLDKTYGLTPWGCGSIRPPIQIVDITSSLRGFVTSEEYTNVYLPKLESNDNICSGESILWDADEGCKVIDLANDAQDLNYLPGFKKQ